MRYGKLEGLLRLALDMQGSAEGISLDDIQRDHGVSRRTAERMRDAIERTFPQMERVNPGELPKRWRLRATSARKLASISVEEMAALRTARTVLERNNLGGVARQIDTVGAKLAALLRPEAARRIAPDLEVLADAEGTAVRPGPRHNIDAEVLAELRYAVMASAKVRLHYTARGTGVASKQVVCPYGFLYGPRVYVVAWSMSARARDYRLFSLANITRVEVLDESFRRRSDFSLTVFAERSFGTFQEEPFDVVWRFIPSVAEKAREFVFHPSQTFEEEADGSLLVRFRAGGTQEMCWHLFTWGDQVEVIEPIRLRDMLAAQCETVLSVTRRPGTSVA